MLTGSTGLSRATDRMSPLITRSDRTPVVQQQQVQPKLKND
jgi:hypothetical protein